MVVRATQYPLLLITGPLFQLALPKDAHVLWGCQAQ